MSTGPSRGWIVLTVAAGTLLTMSALAAVVQVLLGNWGGAVFSALWAVVLYWFAAGAWRRTPWSDLGEGEPTV